MRVKRFVAPSVQEAMVKVKFDMGPDAVIIHTRKYKEGGFWGLFAKTMFEVTAAIEEQPAVKGEALTSSTNGEVQSLPAYEDGHLQAELSEMKGMLTALQDQLEAHKGPNDYPIPLQQFYEYLAENDVDEKLIRRFMNNLQKAIDEDRLTDESMEQHLTQLIVRTLKKPKPIVLKSNSGQQIMALVGPTGVGKTTTMAKLAATFSIVDKKKVALITADTYRIAAVEQLKTFGEIIGIPVDVVYNAQDFKAAVKKHKDKDLILVDTAGRSHKNELQMNELNQYLDLLQPTEIFLVLSATTKTKDMLEILEAYQEINLTKLIFTKLDETTTYGAILNVVNESKLPLSYVTFGQSVPDDIEVADGNKLAKMIIGERS